MDPVDSALVSWINTFPDLSNKCSCIEDLCDGVLLSEIFHQISPSYMDLSSIKHSTEGNWLLKLHNLKKLSNSLDLYYKHQLQLDISHIIRGIDLSGISKEGDSAETKQLVELILGVAIECEDKTTYVGRILALEKQNQLLLKNIITKIDERHSQTPTYQDPDIEESLDNGFTSFSSSNSSSFVESDHSLQINLISAENVQLKEEKIQLIQQITELEKLIQQTNKQLSESSSVNQDTQLSDQQLRSALHQQHLLEDQLHDKEMVIRNQQQKIEELAQVQNEHAKLRDELVLLKGQYEQNTLAEHKLQTTNTLLDDTKDELIIAKTRIQELEEQLKGNSIKSSNQMEVQTIKKHYEESLKENEKLLSKISLLESQLNEERDTNTQLRDIISKLRTKMRQMADSKQEELSKETERLQSEFSEKELTLQTKLSEKEKELEHQKNRLLEYREISQREQKLVMSAFYQMGWELTQKSHLLPQQSPVLSTSSSFSSSLSTPSYSDRPHGVPLLKKLRRERGIALK